MSQAENYSAAVQSNATVFISKLDGNSCCVGLQQTTPMAEPAMTPGDAAPLEDVEVGEVRDGLYKSTALDTPSGVSSDGILLQHKHKQANKRNTSSTHHPNRQTKNKSFVTQKKTGLLSV
jgi:hypothetical protein